MPHVMSRFSNLNASLCLTMCDVAGALSEPP